MRIHRTLEETKQLQAKAKPLWDIVYDYKYNEQRQIVDTEGNVILCFDCHVPFERAYPPHYHSDIDTWEPKMPHHVHSGTCVANLNKALEQLRARLAEAEGRIFELETLLAKLTNDHTPEQKRIIELRDVQGMTWKAIAETMGMSLDRVRSNYIRGYMLARKKKALQHPQGTEEGEQSE